MFNRLKNWVFNHSAPDHAVASFAWFGFSALTAGTAALFPAFAPIALGTAAVASKIGVIEGILTGAHVVSGALSWLFGKIFKPKAQPAAPKTPAPSNTKSEKSKEETHQPQNSQEQAKTETSEKAQPQPVKQNPLAPMPMPELLANQERPVQAPLELTPEMFEHGLNRLFQLGWITKETKVELYNWGEPFLHPELDKILHILTI